MNDHPQVAAINICVGALKRLPIESAEDAVEYLRKLFNKNDILNKTGLYSPNSGR
jgi:hypothetical protein